MASGPKNVTSTTNSEPPSYLIPALQSAANFATSSFTGQPISQFGPNGFGSAGQPYIPSGVPAGRLNYFQNKFGDDLSGASPQQRARMEQKFGINFNQQPIPMARPGSTAGTDRDTTLPGALGGSGLIGDAQSLISDTIGGKFLSPGSNPYLEQTFNQGADLITKRLNTSFAGAGRDLDAARPAAADELGSFASNLFGNAYNTERANQIDAVRSTLDFDPLNLFINRLAGIIPGAGGTTQSTQPVFRTGIF